MELLLSAAVPGSGSIAPLIPSLLILLAVVLVVAAIGYVIWASRRPTFKKNTSRFFRWTRDTLDFLCERPDHLQRLAIIGAGVSLYPLVLGLIWIVWKGYGTSPEILTQSLGIMGFALFGAMGLLALVVVSLLGTIKGLRIMGPGGSGIDLSTTFDDPDLGPETDRGDTTVIAGGGRGRGRVRRYDRQDQGAPPQPQAEGDIGEVRP